MAVKSPTVSNTFHARLPSGAITSHNHFSFGRGFLILVNFYIDKANKWVGDEIE